MDAVKLNFLPRRSGGVFFFCLFAEVLLCTAFELFSSVFGSCLDIFPAGKEKRKGFVVLL
jgi:hypothetical protein